MLTYRNEGFNRLRKREQARTDGRYSFRWTDMNGKRHYIYGRTLEELRWKEKEIEEQLGIDRKRNYWRITVNDIYVLWKQLKRGIRNNTMDNYIYIYEKYVYDDLGMEHIVGLEKSDIRRFYNRLVDVRGLKANTVDDVHTVLHQVLQIAVDDGYIRTNPSDCAMKELKKEIAYNSRKVRALTVNEQVNFMNFMKNSELYSHWYPIFAILLNTGLRSGELLGLRWCDIDMDKRIIDINHTLVRCDKSSDRGRKSYYDINPPKTSAGIRKLPMTELVYDAFKIQKELRLQDKLECKMSVGEYTDFIFLNKLGCVQSNATLNKAIDRIVRDYNKAEQELNPESMNLLPHFSCHVLRHTFATRMNEAKCGMRTRMAALGQTDIMTNMQIYTDITEEYMKEEFATYEQLIKRMEESLNKPTET